MADFKLPYGSKAQFDTGKAAAKVDWVEAGDKPSGATSQDVGDGVLNQLEKLLLLNDEELRTQILANQSPSLAHADLTDVDENDLHVTAAEKAAIGGPIPTTILFENTQTWQVPAGVTKIRVRAQGGGGSGGHYNLFDGLDGGDTFINKGTTQNENPFWFKCHGGIGGSNGDLSPGEKYGKGGAVTYQTTERSASFHVDAIGNNGVLPDYGDPAYGDTAKGGVGGSGVLGGVGSPGMDVTGLSFSASASYKGSGGSGIGAAGTGGGGGGSGGFFEGTYTVTPEEDLYITIGLGGASQTSTSGANSGSGGVGWIIIEY